MLGSASHAAAHALGETPHPCPLPPSPTPQRSPQHPARHPAPTCLLPLSPPPPRFCCRERRSRRDPSTPDVHQACSKRAFEGQVKQWRRLLHAFDPPTEEEAAAVGGGSAEAADDFELISHAGGKGGGEGRAGAQWDD